MRGWWRRDGGQDAALALLALATELPGYWWQGWGIVVTEVALAAAIALRRVRTWLAAVLFGVAFAVQPLLHADPPTDQLCLIGLVGIAYAFGSRQELRPAVGGLLLTVAGGSAQTFLEHQHDYLFVAGVALIGWFPGVLVRQRQREVVQVRAQADAEQREHRLRVEAALAAQRDGLARELHDVVSHGVSAMVLQASAAQQVLRTAPDRAEEALERVQETGREAIAELQRLLVVLRSDEGDRSTAPAPGLASLAALVAQARAGGQDVRLDAEDLGPLPAALELSAYRIVQEGLTNARKHAPGSRVVVSVCAGVGGLEVEVVDSGGSSQTGPGDQVGTGSGLRGLRERAAAFAGTLSAGPTPDGFRVRAVLPVPEQA